MNEKIHTTVGVYIGDMSFKINGVRDIDLKDHIEYNKTFRFGRSLLVDGKVEYLGYFKESDREMLEEKFKDCVRHFCTAPYV